MFKGLSTALVIPVLDAADTIGPLLDAIDRSLVDSIIVVDNGSKDRSDDPGEVRLLLAALHESGADMVIGSRALGNCERGALSPVQRFGNALTCSLLRLFWGQRATDLGPFRAIRRSALDRLAMADPDFCWMIEMQVKAAQQGLSVVEVPVSHRLRRGGRSKVSRTPLGSWNAGRRILGYVIAAKAAELRLALRMLWPGGPPREHLLLFTRFPRPGHSKTRLIPALGEEGAALLHARLAEHAAAQARALAAQRGAHLIVCHADGDERAMSAWLGPDLSYRPQHGPDLGARMADAFAEVFKAGAKRAVLMGSDCPALDTALLDRAFAALSGGDLVLGPAADGGYTLVGLRRPIAQLFDGMAWGGPDVFAETLLRARRLGLRIALLDTLRDIDRPEDLEHAGAFLPSQVLQRASAS